MAILATFFSTGFPPHGFDSVAGFGGAAGPGLGARAGGGLSGAVASLGLPPHGRRPVRRDPGFRLPGGAGFSLSAGGGVGVRLCLGGAVVGCALGARREGTRWGGSWLAGSETGLRLPAGAGLATGPRTTGARFAAAGGVGPRQTSFAAEGFGR